MKKLVRGSAKSWFIWFKSGFVFFLKINKYRYSKFEGFKKSRPYYHPGKSGAILIGNEEIGHFGEFHPNVINELEIKTNCCAFELNLTKAISFQRNKSDTKSELKIYYFKHLLEIFHLN